MKCCATCFDMSTPVSRAESHAYTRPLRLSSLARQPATERTPVIQQTPDDGPPPGHPHVSSRTNRHAALYPALPTSPPPGLPLPATPKPVQLPYTNELPPVGEDDADVYDQPPTPGPGSPAYGGVVDEAAGERTPVASPQPPATELPAPPSPVVAEASRPVSVIVRPAEEAQLPSAPADVEIEVRGPAGARVVTIRLRS